MHSAPPTLFLHGGPGLSAIAERDLYEQTLPIHWWDQPRSAVLFARPFGALVDAAEEEARQLAEVSDQPVDLVAHSFGAHLALRLVQRMPERIGRVWLLAPVHDMGNAFVRLATCLLTRSSSSHPLLAALEEFKADSDYARFARLASQVTSFANFFDLYWSAGAQARRLWYLDLLARHNVIDANAFEVIVRDFWAEPPSPAPTCAAPVSIVFGREDPLIDLDAERRTWAALFPQAQFSQLDTGHFVHLEAPPADWWRTL